MDDSTIDGLVEVQSDGTCLWLPLGVYAAHCPINIKWFPFDNQICSLYFESWNFKETQLNLTNKDNRVILKHYRRSSQWELTSPYHAYYIKYSVNSSYLLSPPPPLESRISPEKHPKHTHEIKQCIKFTPPPQICGPPEHRV